MWARGRDDRALRLAPRTRGDHLAHARVSPHPAAGARYQAEPRPPCGGGERRCGAGSCLGLSACRGVIPDPAAGAWSSSSGVTPAFRPGLAAVVTRVPFVSVTTDAVPGAVGRAPRAICCSQRGGLPRGPISSRVRVTGTPVRPELAASLRSESRRTGPQPGRPRPAVQPPDRGLDRAGRSVLGVNQALAELAELWAACTTRALYHVTGRRDYDASRLRALSAPRRPRSRLPRSRRPRSRRPRSRRCEQR